jgi:hypothetical protein
MEAARLNDRQE